jgi:hypothetical protein
MLPAFYRSIRLYQFNPSAMHARKHMLAPLASAPFGSVLVLVVRCEQGELSPLQSGEQKLSARGLL